MLIPDMEINAHVDYRIGDMQETARKLAIAREQRQEAVRPRGWRRAFRLAIPQFRQRPA